MRTRVTSRRTKGTKKEKSWGGGSKQNGNKVRLEISAGTITGRGSGYEALTWSPLQLERVKNATSRTQSRIIVILATSPHVHSGPSPKAKFLIYCPLFIPP